METFQPRWPPRARQAWTGRRWVVGLVCALSCFDATADPPSPPTRPASTSATTAKPWRLCLPDIDDPPALSTNPAKPGLVERLMLAAGERAGIAFRVQYAPIPRCFALLARGEIDAALAAPSRQNWPIARFPMIPGDKRVTADAVDQRRRILRTSMLIVKRLSSPLTWDGKRFGSSSDDMPPLVGVRRNLSPAVEKLRGIGVPVDDTALSLRHLLSMLRLGRFEAGVAMASELQRERMRHGWTDLQTFPDPLLVIEYYGVVSPTIWAQDPDRANAWWDAIGQLREQPPFDGVTKG